MLLAAIGKPFIPGWSELRAFSAELWIIATILAVLIAPFFSRRSKWLCAGVTVAGLLGALITMVGVGTESTSGLYFRGLLIFDSVAYFWKAILLIFTMGIVALWAATSESTMHESDGPEFFTVLLGAVFGMCLMASTSNLLMLVMAVEMASLPSYVLAGFRKTHKIGAEASLKYVLFGAATSAVMIYGASMLYGLYGTLQIHELASKMTATSGGTVLLAVGLFGLIVGIGFKISAVPFHFWCPDVFEGAGIDVTAFLSVASKGAGLVLLMRVMMTIAHGMQFSNATLLTVLASVIGVLGVASMTVGNLAAVFQHNIKRLLAYSSIAHAGYMLCAVSLLVKSSRAESGFDPASEAGQALLIYLAVYLFMNLGAFAAAGVVWRQTGSENLIAFAGLGQRAPILAACMTAALVSLIGFPPLAGFTAKFNLMAVLAQNGGWWWALVAMILLNTVFSLYVYMRVAKAMYLEKSDEPAFLGQPIGVGLSIASAVLLVVMFFGWNGMTRMTSAYERMYFPVNNAVVEKNVVEKHPHG